MKNIIALYGKSGSGKDYIANALNKKYGYHRLIRTTSRKMRHGEKNGMPYFFKDELELQKDITDNIENYLEVGIFNGFLYATHSDELKSKISVGCFDVEAVEQLLENKKINIIPIYIWSPDKLRLIRQLEREIEPDIDEICRRYFDDKKKYNFFEFNHFKIENFENVEETSILIKQIVDNNLK